MLGRITLLYPVGSDCGDLVTVAGGGKARRFPSPTTGTENSRRFAADVAVGFLGHPSPPGSDVGERVRVGTVVSFRVDAAVSVRPTGALIVWSTQSPLRGQATQPLEQSTPLGGMALPLDRGFESAVWP